MKITCVLAGLLMSLLSANAFADVNIPIKGVGYSAPNVRLIESPATQNTHTALGDNQPTGGCVFESTTGVFTNNMRATAGGYGCAPGTKLEKLSGHRFIVYFYQPTIYHTQTDGSICATTKGDFIDNGTVVETTPYVFTYRKNQNINFDAKGYQIMNVKFGRYVGTVCEK